MYKYKFASGWGPTPNPARGTYDAPPDDPTRLVGRGDRIHSRAFGTCLGACGDSVLPTIFVRGAACVWNSFPDSVRDSTLKIAT